MYALFLLSLRNILTLAYCIVSVFKPQKTMATLKNGIEFTGSLGNVSAYKVKGSDKTFIRTKGGGSKSKIRKSASCKPILDNATDFGRSSTAGSNIRWMLTYVKHLSDYRYASALTSLATNFLKYDTGNEKGKRAIRFATHRNLLPGFNLSKGFPFDSILRHPLTCTVDRESVSTVVRVPELIPGVNLFIPWKVPVYRFIISLGALTDEAQKVDTAKTDQYVKHITSAWQTTSLPFAAQQFELGLSEPLGDDQTLVVSVGIEMGEPVTTEVIRTLKRMGSAKILAAG